MKFIKCDSRDVHKRGDITVYEDMIILSLPNKTDITFNSIKTRLFIDKCTGYTEGMPIEGADSYRKSKER